MNINTEEYTTKLNQVTNGLLSEEAWKEYCQDLLNEILEDAKDIFVRMKERGD
jgi:hypothetical protein